MSDKIKKDESVDTSTVKASRSSKRNSMKRATSSTKTHKTKANSSPKLSPEQVKKSIEAKIDAFFELNKEFNIKKLVSANKLMEVGANIGTPLKYWNPKMKPFIYSNRNSKNCIIDLLKCMVFLDRAYNFLHDLTREGGRILIVGTKGEIIKNHVKEEAKRAQCFYVNQRWLGGTLTNFRTINRSIIKLNNLIMMQLSGEIKKYSKKEQLQKVKESEKLGKFFGGIRTMKGLPQALIVIDPVAEHNAVTEARKLNIPIVALANTNADPSLVDFIVPCNTYSIRAVYLLLSVLCDAICVATGGEQIVVGKTDNEIVLPDLTRKVQNQEVIVSTKFTKGMKKADSEEETKTEQPVDETAVEK